MPASHLIVGLGNPGEEYARTRHNVGFMVVDLLAQRWGVGPLQDKRYGARVARGGERVLLEPLSYMNLSGEPVRKALEDLELSPDRLIVVHDDLDLPVGRLKLVSDRGAGGHKGVSSIIDRLGTQAFARVRLGIDRGPSGKAGTVDWVLTPFSKAERELVEPALARAADAVEAILARGLEAAANAYNREP